MTEAEWLNTKSIFDMLLPFPAKWDQRKLWLFGCACLRRHWHLLADERTRRCVEVAERFVDDAVTGEELNAAWDAFDGASEQGNLERFFDSHEVIRNLIGFVDPAASVEVAWRIAEGVGHFAADFIPSPDGSWPPQRTQVWKEAETQERAEQTDLLRDIVGNPFRPVSFSPDWRTDTVVALARQMYESREFGTMPILADALQDAGCDNDDVLSHCRDANQLHVRGCWVTDLVLGKG